jgi:hypothetical protein
MALARETIEDICMNNQLWFGFADGDVSYSITGEPTRLSHKGPRGHYAVKR